METAAEAYSVNGIVYFRIVFAEIRFVFLLHHQIKGLGVPEVVYIEILHSKGHFQLCELIAVLGSGLFHSLAVAVESFLGNARSVGGIFEKIMEKQSLRVDQISNPSDKDWLTITLDDIPN